MKIALVVHDFDPRYGQGRYAVEIARRLARQHDVHIYANSFAAPWEPNLTCQRVPAWRAMAFTTVFTFLKASEKLLRQRYYDVVHAQGLSCWQADVITAHICNAARYRHSAPGPFTERLFPCIISPWERRFYHQRRARHLLAISRQVAQEIATYYHWKKPVTVVYHGTDTEQFRPAASNEERARIRAGYGLNGSDWAWLFVGQAAKGLSEVIEQLAAFPEATLLVISWSDLNRFKAMARALGVQSRIRWQGGGDFVARACQAADVFVYPSAYDAFGLVVAEAMASELPVIVGQNIGAAEWIVSDRNGLLCDPAHPASIRQQLGWIRADRDRAREMGRAARKTVLEHSWDTCAEKTLAVYEQVLKERSPR